MTLPIPVREAIMYLKGFNACMEEIVKNSSNPLFSSNLFVHVVYPLRDLIKGWDKWHDTEMKEAYKPKKSSKIPSIS